MENKKIVVLGGSFNPPTIAHFKLLQAAVDAIDADKGLFLPAPESYVYRKLARQRHKSETLPDSVRIDLLEAMSADDPRIEVEDYEMHRPRPGFTYESLEYIQEKILMRQYISSLEAISSGSYHAGTEWMSSWSVFVY